MSKKNKKKNNKSLNKQPQIVDEKIETVVKKKKGKKVKVTNKVTTVIENKNKDILSFGERSVKDFIAVDIDRTSEEHLRIGDKYVRSFIVNGYPSIVNVGWLDDLYNSEGDVDTMVHIVPSDERKAIEQLTNKITQFEAQLSLELNKGNIKNITALQDKVHSLIEQRRSLEQNNESLFYIQIAANVYEDSKEKLKKQVQKISNKLKGRRIHIDEMYLRQEESYKTALPIGQSFIQDKFRNFNSGALSATFPFYNSEITHKNGVLIGINGSTATPMFIDFYDRSILNNSNVSVFGQAGSGKTFFVSLLTLRSAIKAIKTVIIDPEGEYDKIARIAGGKIIKLSPDTPEHINPFDIEVEIHPDTNRPVVDVKSKVSDLLNLVAVMVGGLTQEQKASVSHIIAKTYKDFGITEDASSLYEIGSFYDEATQQLISKRKKQMPTLSDLRTRMQQYVESDKLQGENSSLRTITNTLQMFCKGGIYDMFDYQTSENLKDFIDAPVINFNVSQLEEGILRPIGMYVAMTWAWEKFVKGKPNVKKRIICDEAWMLLNKNMAGHEFTAQFLETTARRIRKRNGGLLVASQNFYEFADSKQGKAVLSNSYTSIFLKQNPTDIDLVQESFKLSDQEKAFLLTAKKGNMLIKVGEESSIAYAMPFSYEHAMIGTDKPSKE